MLSLTMLILLVLPIHDLNDRSHLMLLLRSTFKVQLAYILQAIKALNCDPPMQGSREIQLRSAAPCLSIETWWIRL